VPSWGSGSITRGSRRAVSAILRCPASPAGNAGKRGLPIRRSRDLGVLGDVIVGARDNTDIVPVRVVGELPEIGMSCSASGTYSCVRLHEIVLGVNVQKMTREVGMGREI